MKKVITLLLTGVLAAGLSGCGKVPVTGRKQILLVSDSELIAASLTQYNEYISGATLSKDKAKTQMVERVGKKISAATESYLKQNGLESEIANLKWEFKLVQDPQVNAFCMPGGKIVVYEGLMHLVSSDDELAVVVGHEVAHAIAKHSNERMSQQIMAEYGSTFLDMALTKQSETVRSLGNTVFGLGAQLGVMLPYSRKHEYEADYLGLIFMTLAGYNPQSAVTFWGKMSKDKGSGADFMSTHPSEEKRIAEIKRRLPEMEKYKK